MDKLNTLRLINTFEKASKGPEQGSQEWLDIRRPHGGKKRGRIGGSEIGSLMGKNYFKPRDELMREKLGHKKASFPDTIHCYFGILFEPVATRCFEQEYNTKILCKDISVLDSNIENFIFSPDGICPMQVTESGSIDLNYDPENKKYLPVLVEIKCPLTRAIVTNKNIPECYLAQVQAGLICLDITHAAIFIDNCFRVCSHEDLNNPCNYNRLVHSSHKTPATKELKTGRVFVYGICLPLNVKKVLQKEMPLYTNIQNKKIIDFGGSTDNILLALLLNVRNNSLKFVYEEPDKYENVDEFISVGEDTLELQGVISWKLFKVSYTLVNQDPDFKQEIIDTMDTYNKGKMDTLEPAIKDIPVTSFSIRSRLKK